MAHFPPRGTRSPLSAATLGRWRAFRFLLNQIRRTAESDIPLKEVLADWAMIARDLAGPKRKRRPQLERYFQKPQTDGDRKTR